MLVFLGSHKCGNQKLIHDEKVFKNEDFINNIKITIAVFECCLYNTKITYNLLLLASIYFMKTSSRTLLCLSVITFTLSIWCQQKQGTKQRNNKRHENRTHLWLPLLPAPSPPCTWCRSSRLAVSSGRTSHHRCVAPPAPSSVVPCCPIRIASSTGPTHPSRQGHSWWLQTTTNTVSIPASK